MACTTPYLKVDISLPEFEHRSFAMPMSGVFRREIDTIGQLRTVL